MLNAEQFSLLKSVLKYSGVDALTSAQDLTVLGTQNLTVLIGKLRNLERECGAGIEKSYEKLAFFDGKSGKDFETLAATFERPVIRMAISKEARDRPIPVDVQSQLREKGATTFNLCGWCQHASSGSFNGHVMIDALCGLSDAKREMPSDYEWVHADTLCKLTSLTAEQCEQVAQEWRDDIASSKSRRDGIRSLIKSLQDIAKNQPDRPLLPSLRHWTHFELGQPIVAFIAQMEGRTTDADWVAATVIKGYRYQDGCVSYGADKPFNSGDYLAGAGGWGGDSRAEFLKKDEFEALRETANSTDEADKAFFEVFMRAALKTVGLDTQHYRQALKVGGVAQ
jgi:hypothetical protein